MMNITVRCRRTIENSQSRPRYYSIGANEMRSAVGVDFICPANATTYDCNGEDSY
jgi:hypothetical protein